MMNCSGAGASGASGPSCAHAASRGQAQGLGGAREHSASFLHLASLTALPAPVTEKAQDVRPSGGSLRGIQFKLPFAASGSSSRCLAWQEGAL